MKEHFPTLTSMEPKHSKQRKTASEVRKAFLEAQQMRLAIARPPLTAEMVRKQQATMKSPR